MAHNAKQGGRGYRATKDEFWYFDQLPPTARAALANAKFNWSSAATFNRWKRGVKGYKTGADVAKTVQGWDAYAIARSPFAN